MVLGPTARLPGVQGAHEGHRRRGGLECGDPVGTWRSRSSTDRRPIETGRLAVFGAEGTIDLRADVRQDSNKPNLKVSVPGGQPIGEEVAWYGLFVMNVHAELAQAFDDFKAGRKGRMPADRI
ncbi:pirin-like C-terminal cupin domain-containing protein [Embleya sp. NPDC005575]|uniref:pirin-like C-terminal cupin domain-containing protein n=1 Tax=Embleya sp. NPDC005575 TaxID=3156892 RepID=UPI0033B2A441